MYLKNSVLYLIIILVWLKKVPNMLSAKNFQFFNGHIAADEESFMDGGEGEVREPDYVSSAHEDRYYVVNPHKYMKIISG